MIQEYLLWFYNQTEKLGIKIWLDGGWGVDALIGEQTRDHDDFDIVIQEKDVETLISFLKGKGYKKIFTDDQTDWNFVVEDNKGNKVDFHVINIDESGKGIYGPKENNVSYPAYSLKGSGIIGGKEVNCLTAEYQIESHTGYELREKDFKDMKLLSEKYNLDLPKEYSS